MKPDERRFWLALREAHGGPYNARKGPAPRDLINGLLDPPIHHKRAWYLLEKWSGRGWYEYGVTLDLGWITPEGWAHQVEVVP